LNQLRVAVVGAGVFGRNHARVIHRNPEVQLVGVIDTDLMRAKQIADEYNSHGYASFADIPDKVDAAIVASPTETHEAVASRLLEADIDVLVEKPIADSSAAGERLTRLAAERGRILQVGHLERFNPALIALERMVTVPLFFEVHRLSVFTVRSLDIDVILDLMIHDLDIVLSLTRDTPDEIRAAGISVLSPKVDIANVRLSFPSGCIANLTASRVSTEKVRKIRLFQPSQYISLDYARQEAVAFEVKPHPGRALPDIEHSTLPVEKAEPLELELKSFFDCIRTRANPRVDGSQATAALHVAESILAKIKEHGDLVAETVSRGLDG
jgi:predicted dehydrogenase